MRKVSACIVNYNGGDTVIKTLETLFAYTDEVELTVYLSDNGSTDGSLQKISRLFPEVIILENGKNIGFGAANNKVLPLLQSDYHVLVNPDIEIDYNVLKEMADYLDCHPEIGGLSPTVLNTDGTVQHLPKLRPRLVYLLAGRLPFFKKERAHFTMADRVIQEPVEIDFCTGCFFFLRTELFQKVGGFDERYFLYFEDADLTREIQKYGKTVYHPDFTVFHKWHRESGKSLKYLLIHIFSMFQYFRKWGWK